MVYLIFMAFVVVLRSLALVHRVRVDDRSERERADAEILTRYHGSTWNDDGTPA